MFPALAGDLQHPRRCAAGVQTQQSGNAPGGAPDNIQFLVLLDFLRQRFNDLQRLLKKRGVVPERRQMRQREEAPPPASEPANFAQSFASLLRSESLTKNAQ